MINKKLLLLMTLVCAQSSFVRGMVDPEEARVLLRAGERASELRRCYAEHSWFHEGFGNPKLFKAVRDGDTTGCISVFVQYAGENVHQKDKDGCTPMSCALERLKQARRFGNEAAQKEARVIIKELKANGAKMEKPADS